MVSLGNKENYQYTVRREPISKSCEITQADNLIVDGDCLGRLNDTM